MPVSPDHTIVGDLLAHFDVRFQMSELFECTVAIDEKKTNKQTNENERKKEGRKKV